MQIAEGQRAHQRQRLLELGVGLAGKAHHHVRAQRQLRPGGTHQRLNLLRVVPGPVAPVHAAQHSVRAGLQGQMRMARQPRSPRRPNSAISPISSASQSIGSIELSRSRGSAVCSKICRTSAASVRGACSILGAERKSRPQRPRLIPESTSSLPPAATNPSTCLRTLCSGQTSGRASRLRNHAKRAAISAPFLDLQVGPRLRAGTSCASSRNECAKRSSAQIGALPASGQQSATAAAPVRAAVDVRCLSAAAVRSSKLQERSPAPAPCGCCPPPRPRRPVPPAPPARAAHSSRSPRFAPRDSAGAPGE